MRTSTILFLLLTSGVVQAQEKYTGPLPPKPDMLYLVHADNLIPLEATDASADQKKSDTLYTIPGASSPARTPLAEPIFLMQSEKIAADRIQLYRLEVKNGHREVTMSGKGKRGGARPLHLEVTRLGNGLYRIEADEPLEDGEYSLSPNDSNRVFCFEVY